MDSFKLSTVIDLQSRFGRSVNLERDFYSDVSLDGYVFTNTAKTSLRRLSIALRDETAARAWTLTGTYGSGKSTFALFAAKLFGSSETPDSGQARSILQNSDEELFDDIFEPHSTPLDFFPVLISGARESIVTALLRGIKLAIEHRTDKKLSIFISKIDELERSPKVTGKEIIGLLSGITNSIQKSTNRNTGLLLVIDELGKLLEFAAIHTDQSDIFILQELAEATRKTAKPFFLITILHQAFERYAERLGRRDRAEWSKIQGRFEDLPFHEPNEQVLYLLESALIPNKESVGFSLFKSVGKELGTSAFELGLCGLLGKKKAVTLLGNCLPLHPTTAIAIGTLFRRHGQNERSLFAFLTSNEPFGLREFLKNVAWSDQSHEVVRLDRVYDYFVSSMGSALNGGPEGRKWAEIETAIRNNPEATDLEIRALKVIGILNLLGDSGKLKSSRDILRFALEGDGIKAKDVDLAISGLERRSAVTERRFNDTFVIWEGSDVDLDERFNEAERQIDASTSLADNLTRYFDPRPIVAKRHSYRTGTLRYFETVYLDTSDILMNEIATGHSADGRILFALSSEANDYEKLVGLIRGRKVNFDQQTIVVIPRTLDELRDAVFRTICWRWVSSNTPELESDRVARAELAARLANAEQKVISLLEDWQTSVTREDCTWFWNNEERRFLTPRELQEFLSDVFDNVYPNTPVILNELVNRNNLSSAATSARRALFEAMTSKADTRQLGIEGFPPQLSMYYSLLDETSIHREANGRLGLFPPNEAADLGIKAVWKEIESFLETTEQDRRSLKELFAELQKPPFGLKAGVLPIIVSAVLIHLDSEVAVYERGNFLPRLTLPIFERMCRVPEAFTLQLCRITGIRTRVLDKIGQVLLPDLKATKKVDILTLVRPLAKFAQDLEEFTQHTTRLSKTTLEIRRALFSAREPDKLLFKFLPQSCGFPEFGPNSTALPKDVEEFAVLLHRGLGELKRAYQELLNEIEGMLISAFSLSLEDGRANLIYRSKSISEFAASAKLKGFILRVSDTDLERHLWLESIAALLAGKPPAVWRDDDLTRFEIALMEIVRSFINLETVVFERLRQDRQGSAGADFLRLSLTEINSGDHERVLQIFPQDKEKMDEAEKLILAALDESSINGNLNLRLATLARLSLKLLGEEPKA